MGKRNREINIFNFSMLDVITGAMGAYLAVMVVLLPYYQKKDETPQETPTMSQAELAKTIQQAEEREKKSEAKAEQLEKKMQALQAQLDASRSEASQQSKQIEHLQSELQRTFMLIHIQWATLGPDVDLHVIDPKGNHFYWRNRTSSGSSGNLSVDSVVGPGNEVFVDSHAIAGDYKIYAHMYNSHGQTNPTEVKGIVIYRDGTLKLPSLTLTNFRPQPATQSEPGKDPSESITAKTPMELIAVLRVDAQGGVRLARPQ